MKTIFSIEIDTDNAAFETSEQGRDELVRILQKIASEINNDADFLDKKIKDINGNSIGNVYLKIRE